MFVLLPSAAHRRHRGDEDQALITRLHHQQDLCCSGGAGSSPCCRAPGASPGFAGRVINLEGEASHLWDKGIACMGVDVSCTTRGSFPQSWSHSQGWQSPAPRGGAWESGPLSSSHSPPPAPNASDPALPLLNSDLGSHGPLATF